MRFTHFAMNEFLILVKENQNQNGHFIQRDSDLMLSGAFAISNSHTNKLEFLS